jgi:hypothetical protein
MRPRACLLGAALALAGLAASGPAQARSRIDFSLVALGTDRYFTFDARPGETVAGRLGLVSRSRHARTVALRPVDVGTAASGGLDYGIGSPRAVGGWLTLEQRRVTLAPGAVVHVPFAARVPDAVRPGDHLAGLVAYEPGRRSTGREKPRTGGVRLAFRSRLAVAVQLRVPGPRHPRLAFRGAEIVDSPSGVRIYLKLENSGNTLVERTQGRVAISREGHELVRAPLDISAFAPDSAIRYPLRLPGTPVQGVYHVTGRLEPESAPPVRMVADVELTDAQATRFEEATGTKVVRPSDSSPLRYLGLLLPLLVGAVFAVAYRGARR